MNKVVITGAGVVSPLGTGYESFMRGLSGGKNTVGRLHGFDTTGFPLAIGAEIDSQRVSTEIDKKANFIKAALQELMKRRAAEIAKYDPSQRRLELGAGMDYFDLPGYVQSPAALTGNWRPYSQSTYKLISELAQKYEIAGGFSVNVSACVASSQSLGLGFRQLKYDSKRKIVIAGGFDSMLNHLHYLGFYKLGALANWPGLPAEACRPFDQKRCGLVLGEGAAVYLLQRAKDAAKEHILAEIAGYASTMDAYMVTDPEPDGTYLAEAAQQAIKEAGITPADIDCVHLHGTGTSKNDIAEAAAMKRIFGKSYTNIPVFSLKAQVGHLIAACGALEMLGVIYSLTEQAVPPTINYTHPDTEVPLMVVKDKPLKQKINYVLKLNAAFGGQNTAFVVKRHA
jgi:3-oxoacyl-[acyl-carrier-protein] synthase II